MTWTMNSKSIKELQLKVVLMYWEYSRLSSSGQKTLDDIATLVGVETQAEILSLEEKINRLVDK